MHKHRKCALYIVWKSKNYMNKKNGKSMAAQQRWIERMTIKSLGTNSRLENKIKTTRRGAVVEKR